MKYLVVLLFTILSACASNSILDDSCESDVSLKQDGFCEALNE
jgi:hypothetical protein